MSTEERDRQQRGVYAEEDIPAGELARMAEVARELADDVRALVHVAVLTDVADDRIARARELIGQATEILGEEHHERSFGTRFNSDGTHRSWGNALTGIRNPIAPPLRFECFPDKVTVDVDLGGAYEGPAGLVHGGIIAAVFDQALGHATESAKVPGMTGTLSIRYRQGTRLGKIHVEAWVDRVEGVKAFAKGELSTDDGLCAEAEGVFIMPKWARGEIQEKVLGRVGD